MSGFRDPPTPGLTAVFSAPFLGGSELFNLEYLRTAHEAGIEIDAVIPETGKLEDALRPLARAIQIVRVPDPLQQISRFDRRLRPGRVVAVGTSVTSYALRLRRALARSRGPLVCFGLRAQLAVGLLQPTLRRRVCWVVHEVVPDGAFAGQWGRVAGRADAIYAYSRTAGTQPNLRGAPVRVMAVRLALRRFSEVPPPRAPPRVLGLVGDLFPLKNHLALVEVVHRLRDRGHPVDGVLVGRMQAEEKDEVDVYIRSVRRVTDDSESHVRLVSTAPDAMPSVMGGIDVLLHLSSIPETFGRVCAEAMAAARPVIAFGHGAVAEIVVDGETGILCPPNDTAAVTDAVVRLLEDESYFLRLSGQARAHAISNYGDGQSAPTIAEALVAFAGSPEN